LLNCYKTCKPFLNALSNKAFQFKLHLFYSDVLINVSLLVAIMPLTVSDVCAQRHKEQKSPSQNDPRIH
jgi:hypothetical protein